MSVGVRLVRDDQDKIADWLSGCAPPLADVYRGAVRLLGDPSFPGRTQFICHAGRDIANRVPDLVGGTMELQRAEPTKDLNELSDLWSRYALDQRGPTGISAVENIGPGHLKDEILIPIAVFRHIGVVLVHLGQAARNHRERATKMLETIAPENKDRQEALVPIANQWVEITRWFVGHTHAGEKATTVNEEELQSKFLTLEHQITTLISSFYEPINILDEILEDTNS